MLFKDEVKNRIEANRHNHDLRNVVYDFMRLSTAPKYSYNFSWLGRPIIQYPQDMIAMQEIIWEVKPDLVIETGIARGGSLIMSASMLALIDYCETVETGKPLPAAAGCWDWISISVSTTGPPLRHTR
jgi:cephalosporin hydroxylase